MGKIMQFYSIGTMGNVLFFSRVTLICNLCFLLIWPLRGLPSLAETDLTSTIIILGYLMAVILNVLLNIILGWLFIRKKKIIPPIPGWLLFTNLAFLIAQLILLIK